jgi:tRNA/tmRNA/rRNA uracil-C5-methylase (TrmA/RlmC/RlmD family)
MNYEAQLGAKQRFVQDALTRIGQLREVDVKPVIGTDQTWNYRRHIKLRVRGTQVGFAGQQANEFVPVEKCLIFAGTLPSIPNTLDASLRWHDKNREFDVGGLHFQYNEHAFVQAHPTQSARLYGDLIQPAKKVLDLYCGIGVTSLLFAKQGAQVVGVEGNAEAIRLAKLNAQHNQIQSVMWHTANVDDVAQALCDEHRPDLILVNPPRTGLNKPVIDALIKSGANQIFYVSCMPSTLARDLALLTASAYRIANCQPYDMFPQTTHVETFVRLIATNQS